MARFRITCTGTAPLLMHNARLSNPLDDVVKAFKRVSGKTKKTEEDHEEMARLEHAGGLYHDEDLGPYIPGANFEKCLHVAAKLTRQGPKIEQGVFFLSDDNPLAYTGPRDIDGLWKDANFRHTASVVVDRKRVTRTRPQFRQWAAEAVAEYDPAIIDLGSIQDIAVTAGLRVGLGDWRPRFGRFEATVEKVA
jgi:hypothetical protein